MMKKLLASLLAAAMTLSLAACGGSPAPSSSSEGAPEGPTTVKVTTMNAEKQVVEIEVPYDPQRLAVMDMAALDMLDNLGVGDRVIGMAKNTYVDYLDGYFKDDAIQNLGTLFESDLEAMMAAEPDVIFIGGRMAKQYDELVKIAPVIYMGVDYEVGIVQSVKNNAQNVASIFGVDVSDRFAAFDTRIAALAAAAEGKSSVNGIVTSGGFNTLGNGARCSLIGGEVGFENLADNVDSTHGNESSFELLVELNPDYIFVLDRDTAIAAEGAQIAQDVMENELVQKTDAYKNGNIVYLTPAPWYLAEGGISSLDAMIGDIEAGIRG